MKAFSLITAIRDRIANPATDIDRDGLVRDLDTAIGAFPKRLRATGRHTGKLTESTIAEAVAAAAGGTKRIGDGGAGLSLLIRGKAAAWQMALRLDNDKRPTSIALGAYPDVSIEEARTRAHANKNAHIAGAELPYAPTKRKHAVPGAGLMPATAVGFGDVATLTFGEAFEATMAEKWLPSFKADSRQPGQIRGSFEVYALPALGHRRVVDIRSGDVVAVLNQVVDMPDGTKAKLWAGKHPTAKALRQKIRAVFGWCAGNGHVSQDFANPAGDVIDSTMPTIRRTTKHRAHEDSNGIHDVIAKLETHAKENPKHVGAVLALLFIIANPLRSRKEVRLMRWQEVDLAAADGPTWNVPAARMKTANGDAEGSYPVPLSPFAVSVLERGAAVREVRPDGFVFAGMTGGGRLGESSMLDVLRMAGSKKTVHGFRGTFRTWCSRNDIDRATAEMCLAHEQRGAVEKSYDHGAWFEQRAKVFGKWSDYLTG